MGNLYSGGNLRALQGSLAGGTVFQMDQAASAYQKVLRQLRECGEVTNLDRRVGLCPRRYRKKAPQPGRLALHFITDFFSYPVREDAHTASVCGQRVHSNRGCILQPNESIRVLTGQQ